MKSFDPGLLSSGSSFDDDPEDGESWFGVSGLLSAPVFIREE